MSEEKNNKLDECCFFSLLLVAFFCSVLLFGYYKNIGKYFFPSIVESRVGKTESTIFRGVSKKNYGYLG